MSTLNETGLSNTGLSTPSAVNEALSSNIVLRNTYILLSMTLLFSALTANLEWR